MNITVFCGSGTGTKSVFCNAAHQLGELIGLHGWNLIYGGASIGLMGTLANATLRNGGTVHGVIPGFLDQREITHTGLSRLTLVESMHERKTIMAAEGDVFVALPGGFGTFEELLEVITWRQLRLLEKPVGLLNIDGFYNDLIQFFKKSKVSGFIRSDLDSYFHTWNSVDSFERFAVEHESHTNEFSHSVAADRT